MTSESFKARPVPSRYFIQRSSRMPSCRPAGSRYFYRTSHLGNGALTCDDKKTTRVRVDGQRRPYEGKPPRDERSLRYIKRYDNSKKHQFYRADAILYDYSGKHRVTYDSLRDDYSETSESTSSSSGYYRRPKRPYRSSKSRSYDARRSHRTFRRRNPPSSSPRDSDRYFYRNSEQRLGKCSSKHSFSSRLPIRYQSSTSPLYENPHRSAFRLSYSIKNSHQAGRSWCRPRLLCAPHHAQRAPNRRSTATVSINIITQKPLRAKMNMRPQDRVRYQPAAGRWVKARVNQATVPKMLKRKATQPQWSAQRTTIFVDDILRACETQRIKFRIRSQTETSRMKPTPSSHNAQCTSIQSQVSRPVTQTKTTIETTNSSSNEVANQFAKSRRTHARTHSENILFKKPTSCHHRTRTYPTEFAIISKDEYEEWQLKSKNNSEQITVSNNESSIDGSSDELSSFGEEEKSLDPDPDDSKYLDVEIPNPQSSRYVNDESYSPIFSSGYSQGNHLNKIFIDNLQSNSPSEPFPHHQGVRLANGRSIKCTDDIETLEHTLSSLEENIHRTKLSETVGSVDSKLLVIATNEEVVKQQNEGKDHLETDLTLIQVGLKTPNRSTKEEKESNTVNFEDPLLISKSITDRNEYSFVKENNKSSSKYVDTQVMMEQMTTNNALSTDQWNSVEFGTKDNPALDQIFPLEGEHAQNVLPVGIFFSPGDASSEQKHGASIFSNLPVEKRSSHNQWAASLEPKEYGTTELAPANFIGEPNDDKPISVHPEFENELPKLGSGQRASEPCPLAEVLSDHYGTLRSLTEQTNGSLSPLENPTGKGNEIEDKKVICDDRNEIYEPPGRKLVSGENLVYNLVCSQDSIGFSPDAPSTICKSVTCCSHQIYEEDSKDEEKDLDVNEKSNCIKNFTTKNAATQRKNLIIRTMSSMNRTMPPIAEKSEKGESHKKSTSKKK